MHAGLGEGTTALVPTAEQAAAETMYKRITWRILPVLFLCYLVAYLDRVNVSFAKLQMLNDLKMSDAVYGIGAGIFFIGYFLFEIPSNLILNKVGARVWIARIMVTWGVLSGLMAFVSTPAHFYALRFLLGAAEAGFYPGVLLYLSRWFPSARRGRITALFMAGNPVSGIVGGPISGMIMQGLGGVFGLTGWQWLFIAEGLPALILGAIVFFRLNDSIERAPWLSETEKAVLIASFEEESKQKSVHSFTGVFRSPRVWILCLIYFGISIGSNTFGFWQPTIIKNSGIANPLVIGFLTSLPYIAALIGMLLAGRSADRLQERRWHVVIPLLVAAAGFSICALYRGDIVIAMGGLTLIAVGVISAIPLFWALPTSFLGGTAAAAGIALINCTGNLGGFVSPVMVGWLTSTTHSLNSGLYLASAITVLTAALIVTCIPASSIGRKR